MKVLKFRPFKRLGDEELIYRTLDAFRNLKEKDQYNKEKMEECNELIREAKYRNLRCSKEILCHQILFK